MEFQQTMIFWLSNSNDGAIWHLYYVIDVGSKSGTSWSHGNQLAHT